MHDDDHRDGTGSGAQFALDSCHSTCEPDKGAKVDVLYRKADPDDARVQVDVRPIPYLAGVLGPLGIAGCVLGFVVYRRGKRKIGVPT